MLKKGTAKRSKICAQSPVNALSTRNQAINQTINNSLLSQHNPGAIEYTLDLQTNLKPPTKLITKKTPECQISLGSIKENIASPCIPNENNHSTLLLRKSPNKIESKSTTSIKYSNSKSRSIFENSIVKKGEFEEDDETAQKVLAIQDELNKLNILEPRSPISPATQGQNTKFLEIVDQLKEVIITLQRKDILQRREIDMLKKNNQEMKSHLAKYAQKLNDFEKAKELIAPSPIKHDAYLAKEKRSHKNGKQRLEEKAHAFAKSALSSPSHKTLDLYDRKKKLIANELIIEKPLKDEKANSINISYAANNEALLVKNQHTPISASHSLQESSSNNLFYSSAPVAEGKLREVILNQTTEIDTLVQMRTVTMSEIENSEEGTCSSHQALSQHNITSLQDIYNTRNTRMFPPAEQFQSLTQREHLRNQKNSRDQVISHRLNLSHQNSPNSSSIISFPNNSFVPSKVRRDEIKDKSNEKDGGRSHSQPINGRKNHDNIREVSSINGNLSSTTSEIMNQYKQYLNEPHVSPLQCESKSINRDFGWHYLTNISKNGDDLKNLSINTQNNLTRNEIKLPTLTDELSKIVIPEELASEEFKRESSYDDKVTLFNRCLKLTMGLGSSVLDENQITKDITKKNLVPVENIVLSPHLSSVKRPFCAGIGVRK